VIIGKLFKPIPLNLVVSSENEKSFVAAASCLRDFLQESVICLVMTVDAGGLH
jgi:hypothetical protein